jgi:iron complex outermembrane receptor protein
VAETVRAYELGHRRLVTTNFWYDIAAFYNVYRHLLTTGSFPTPFSNQAHARTYGVELASRWQATPSWRLDAAYTYLQMEVAEEANATAVQGADRGQNPHHQLALRSAFDVGRNLEFDATLRFVDDLPTFDVPAYTELDLGLSWLARPGLELSLVGQNLLDSHHPEQRIVNPTTGVVTGTEVQRGVYVKLTSRF